MAGRKTKLTPELQDRLVTLLRAGNYIETAAAFCDVTKATLYAWLKRGNRLPGSIYGAFLNAVEKAQAEAEIRDLEAIRQAPEWQARAWRLERKFPHKWGKHDRLDLGAASTEPLRIVIDDGGAAPAPDAS